MSSRVGGLPSVVTALAAEAAAARSPSRRCSDMDHPHGYTYRVDHTGTHPATDETQH